MRRSGGQPTPPAVLAEVAKLAEADAPQVQPVCRGPIGPRATRWRATERSGASSAPHRKGLRACGPLAASLVGRGS
eukprot:9041605-Alexandrium_andersonii.AAC.1